LQFGRGVRVPVLAAIAFLCSWLALGQWFYAHGRISDIGVYQTDGLQVRAGALPYRDFPLEYPPGAIVVFVAPTFVGQPSDQADYGRWFGRLMAVCGLACLGLVLLSRPPGWGIAFVALSPLLVGWLMLLRFDLWPACLTAAAVAAFVRDRHRLGWLALGLAVAAKLYAGVLLPLAVVWTLRRRGLRELRRGGAIWVGTVAAVFAPFAVLAPHGLWESLWGQLSRPVQIESLGASLVMALAHPAVQTSHHSISFVGHRGIGLLTSIVETGCLAALWVGFARGPAEEERFVRFAAASAGAFVAFCKVLSPQYLIWLVPLVALVRGRRGLAATLLLAVAAIDTQFWIEAPRYAAYKDEYRYAWLVVGRNLLLVASVAVLGLPVPRRRARVGAMVRAGSPLGLRR
jgi:ABC-type amino acid transport substrate-binding protein